MSRTFVQVSNDIRLAGVKMPGNVNEKHWNDAKKKAHEEYGYSEDNPRFWKIVQAIYSTMEGK